MTATEILRERLAEFGAALALLTRVPVPKPPWSTPYDADAVWAYPLVGALVGALGGAVYWITHALSCPPALTALWALAAMILATGALHEDGLADFADGLAGETPEKRLAIMRDHHIGTYGVIALILSLGLRATAIALIAAPGAVFASLIAVDAASRVSAVLVMTALQPARSDGLSASVGRPSAGLAAASAAIAVVIAWLALAFGTAMLVVVSAAVSAAVIGYIAKERLGGQTGDVLGASSQLCQCLALAVLVVA